MAHSVQCTSAQYNITEELYYDATLLIALPIATCSSVTIILPVTLCTINEISVSTQQHVRLGNAAPDILEPSRDLATAVRFIFGPAGSMPYTIL